VYQTNKQQLFQCVLDLKTIGTWLAVISCFSVAALGTAVTTISTLTATTLWLITTNFSDCVKATKTNNFTLVAFLLFAYLGLSLFWTADIVEGLSFWKKYREFILVIIFISYFSQNNLRHYGLIALYAGMCLSLFISYLVYFGFIKTPPRHYAIDNDIFNGLLFSFLSYWSLNLALNYKKYRLLFIASFIFSLFSIFFIREGRTGYIIFIALTILFIVQHWKLKGLFVICLITLAPAYFFLLNLLDLLHLSFESFTNFEKIDLDYLSELDIRLEYYINTIRTIGNHYLTGVGVGSFAFAYLESHKMHVHFWPPVDNAHNEFFMIWVQTGLPGIILFLLFFIYLIKAACQLPPNQSQLAMAVIVTTGITCLFNSSILDANDGALIMLLIALFFSQPSKKCPLQPKLCSVS